MEPNILAIGGTIVALITGAGIFVRRFSRDKLELAKDRAEEDLITHLRDQRDFAISERDKALMELASTKAELASIQAQIYETKKVNSTLAVQVDMLNKLVSKLTESIERTKSHLKGAAAEIIQKTSKEEREALFASVSLSPEFRSIILEQILPTDGLESDVAVSRMFEDDSLP